MYDCEQATEAHVVRYAGICCGCQAELSGYQVEKQRDDGQRRRVKQSNARLVGELHKTFRSILRHSLFSLSSVFFS